MRKGLVWVAVGVFLMFGFAANGYAQFSSSLQGVVQDANGAVIPGATVTLTNNATGVSQTTATGGQGDFRLVSLAPGSYQVTTTAKGFTTSSVAVTLQTEQNMNVPVTLSIASMSQTVQVTGRAPVLDTADSRTQLTLNSVALSALPLPGRSLLSLVSTAPGVTGLGIIGSGGNGQSNDNFAAETQVSVSANGRSSASNMFVVDGLDITSNITGGVLNLVPNPDTVAETTVQVNTYSVEYGRSSSITEVMTTKAGSDQYHLLLSDYFTNQMLTAGTEF
ncbi:MAG: carboxypeptidase-like regulatory domain-containing protein, partial [Candidatus Acidiferrales bacterium]